MALPDNTLSTTAVVSEFIGGAALAVTRTQDYETGAGALNDPTLGMFYQMWAARIVNNKILIKADNLPEFEWYSGTAVEDVSIAFDQNMRLYVAYTDMGVTYLYWFNTEAGEAQTLNFGTGHLTPKISLDDKRAYQSGASDIIFAYVRDGKLYHRRQRDRFATEYLLSNGPFLGINKMGMNAGLRFQFLMAPVDNPD